MVPKYYVLHGISTWLWNIARGISGEAVEGRLLPKSHGSGKTFPGPRALKTVPAVRVLCYQIMLMKHYYLFVS